MKHQPIYVFSDKVKIIFTSLNFKDIAKKFKLSSWKIRFPRCEGRPYISKGLYKGSVIYCSQDINFKIPITIQTEDGSTIANMFCALKDQEHLLLSEVFGSKWKPVLGYEGDYWVSMDGRFASKTGKLLVPSLVKGRTCQQIGFLVKSKGKTRTIVKEAHRVVGEAFVPNLNNLKFLLMIDGDHTNINADNLYWTRTMPHMHGDRVDRKTILCQQCSEEFTVTINSKRKCCSYACAHDYSRGRSLPEKIQTKITKTIQEANNIPIIARRKGSKIFRRFESITAFSNRIGISTSHIINIIAGRYNNTTGFDVIKKEPKPGYCRRNKRRRGRLVGGHK